MSCESTLVSQISLLNILLECGLADLLRRSIFIDPPIVMTLQRHFLLLTILGNMHQVARRE